jgi:hypothetical protein
MSASIWDTKCGSCGWQGPHSLEVCAIRILTDRVNTLTQKIVELNCRLDVLERPAKKGGPR